MKSCLSLIVAMLTLVVSGCASTVRSDVTVFHEWPAELTDKSYVFERTRDQDNNLEYRSYENLVRAELQRLGFTEAGVNTRPQLKVGVAYRVQDRDVRVVEPVVVNPGWSAPYYPYYYGPRWAGYRYRDPLFYDPFWYSPPIVHYQDSSYRLFTRQLQITIARMADNKKLYDVTVHSEGQNASLAAIMPYMIKSAFTDFPGPSGVSRRIELPMRE